MSPRPQQLYKELDLFAFVGLIMLFGVVKKNAIMMIDFALEAQRRDGRDPRNAIYAGCLLRFRPIMMTTAAALFGTMPIALGYGEGAVDVKKTSASLSSTIKISTDVWAISTASANPDGFVGHPLHYRLGRNERGNGG